MPTGSQPRIRIPSRRHSHENEKQCHETDTKGDLNSLKRFAASAMPLYQRCLLVILTLSPSICLKRAMMQTMEALLFMHEQRVLHRDVKPHDILISKMSPLVVALSDYGTAISFDERDSLYTFCGTAGFTALDVSWGLKQTTAVEVYSLS